LPRLGRRRPAPRRTRPRDPCGTGDVLRPRHPPARRPLAAGPRLRPAPRRRPRALGRRGDALLCRNLAHTRYRDRHGDRNPAPAVEGVTMSDTTPDQIIHATDLRKAYGSTRALDGLDLDVARGEVHGF